MDAVTPVGLSKELDAATAPYWYSLGDTGRCTALCRLFNWRSNHRIRNHAAFPTTVRENSQNALLAAWTGDNLFGYRRSTFLNLAGQTTMSTAGSISVLIRSFRDGDEEALARLHARYWPVLVSIARRKLRGAPLREADEEDVAQQAFWSFVRSVRAGRLPKLDNRHDLLAILTHITSCKVLLQFEREFGTQKRGRRHRQGTATRDQHDGNSSASLALLQLADSHTTPIEEALLHDSYDHYLSRLPEKLRPLARFHLAGYSNREIAGQLGCVERTVERKLVLLRLEWERLAVE